MPDAKCTRRPQLRTKLLLTLKAVCYEPRSTEHSQYTALQPDWGWEPERRGLCFVSTGAGSSFEAPSAVGSLHTKDTAHAAECHWEPPGPLEDARDIDWPCAVFCWH